MMVNLFSIFDPVSGVLGLSLNWLVLGFVFFFMVVNFWLMGNFYGFFWGRIFLVLEGEFSLLINKSDGGILYFLGCFFMIVFSNLMGLLPYVFTASSHLVFGLTLSLSLWVGFMIYGWINNTYMMLVHLVPSGTPNFLVPVMVLIETLSNVMRPGTLSVRLTANMVAGHLLLSLMGNQGVGMSPLFLGILLLVQGSLVVLEFAVAMIQGYVFSVLGSLYVGEIN